MNPLPSPEEAQWLSDALRKLICSRGAELLDGAPLVEPTNDWFPEKWSATAAHGHRLAQRLLYYARLGALRPTLSAYEAGVNADGSEPWDARTAGWFAGNENGRAHFGLHVREFSDPEAAAGVLAHEVAHAWRAHHRLVIPNRDEEELLTDVTTVVLGFGILSTNNTDRYRSTGTWSVTAWSVSSAGYLPPQAMAYLLALWCKARDQRGESKTIERHLEPNQRAFFRAALDHVAQAFESPRAFLIGNAPRHPIAVIRPESFRPDDPGSDEISEPEYESGAEVNRGKTVYRKARGAAGAHAYFGLIPGFAFGAIAGLIAFGERSIGKVFAFAVICAAVSTAYMLLRSRSSVCSACGTPAQDDHSVCKGCGGNLGPRVTERELRRLREEDLDRRAVVDVPWEECDQCEPEHPCPKHGVAAAALESDEIEPESDEPADATAASVHQPHARMRLRLVIETMVAIGLLVVGAVAWWRQNHIPVYFDNALERPLTLTLDGKTMPFEGRLAILRKLKPGRHSIVVSDHRVVVERFDPTIPAPNLFDALLEPRFFVYNAAGVGIYEHSRFVYSTSASERSFKSELIGLVRWIEQPSADYVFKQPPDHLPTAKATKTAFTIARNVGPRDLAGAWFQEGRHEDALRVLKQAIERAPCDAGLRGDVVDLLDATDQGNRAVAESAAWVASCGDSIAAHRAYQNTVRAHGDRGALLEQYRGRLERDSSAANHYLLGRLLDGLPARKEYEEALRLDPSLNLARAALGYELLAAEDDERAFTTLEEAMRKNDVPPGAPVIFAMAAVAVNDFDRALGVLSQATVDPLDAWDASWLLVRAKHDWQAAKLLLLKREDGKQTPETKVLRARVEWEAGGVRDSIIEDLRNDPQTEAAANMFSFEDAFEHGRFADASAMTKLPELYATYAAEAAILAGTTPSAETASAIKEPFFTTLLQAAKGQIDESTMLHRTAEMDVRMWPHAWFALGVRAATTGDHVRAAQLFRKSADRALDRDFPHALASALAERYGR